MKDDANHCTTTDTNKEPKYFLIWMHAAFTFNDDGEFLFEGFCRGHGEPDCSEHEEDQGCVNDFVEQSSWILLDDGKFKDKEVNYKTNDESQKERDK